MARTIKDVLNDSNPNSLPNAMQALPAGNAMALGTAYVRGAVATNKLTLPEGAKAAQATRVFAIAGTSTGYKLVAKQEATPAAGSCAINATGDIVFASADGVTSAEAYYMPLEGKVVTEALPVVGSVATIPQGCAGAILLEASVTSGVTLGAKAVQPKGTASASGQAELALNGLTIVFNSADVVAGMCLVKYVQIPGIGTAAPSVSQNLASEASY